MVFGRVVSGQPVVMQIEELGVDKNSRPLQDAKVVKCGELVLKSKIKRMFIETFYYHTHIVLVNYSFFNFNILEAEKEVFK